MTVMSTTPGRKRLSWRGKTVRSLRDAAQAACEAAAAERLPIHAVLGAGALEWHARNMLKVIPVRGMKNGLAGRVPADAALSGDLGHVEQGAWSELTVERQDFDSYLAWLRTVW